MTKFADLHIHTFFSDSTSSPEDVASQAHKNGVACIAITDHDTMDGVLPTTQAAATYDVEVVPGIELSSEFNGKDMHILGYFMDPAHAPFQTRLHAIQTSRISRIAQMIENLRTKGIDNITLDEVCALTQSAAVGRPHLAAVLVKKGWVQNNYEAFAKYLAEGCDTYVAKYNQSPFEAIDLIRQAGGVAVLAHPMVTARDEVIPALVEAGLGGIEVYYPYVPESMIRFYESLAKKHDLVMTGGSDDHGNRKTNTYIGKQKVPYENVEQLRQRAKSVKA